MADKIKALPMRSAVIMDLREGYGSEDIALLRSVHVETVRRIVDELRRCGVIANIRWERAVEARG